MNECALVDSDDIDVPDNEGITEDDAADTTFRVSVRIGKFLSAGHRGLTETARLR